MFSASLILSSFCFLCLYLFPILSALFFIFVYFKLDFPKSFRFIFKSFFFFLIFFSLIFRFSNLSLFQIFFLIFLLFIFFKTLFVNSSSFQNICPISLQVCFLSGSLLNKEELMLPSIISFRTFMLCFTTSLLYLLIKLFLLNFSFYLLLTHCQVLQSFFY